MDDFIEALWRTVEDEINEKWPDAVISASAPERNSDEGRLSIRAGDRSHILILGGGVMDREDPAGVVRALREGAWIALLRQYGCLKVEHLDDDYHLVLCESPGTHTS